VGRVVEHAAPCSDRPCCASCAATQLSTDALSSAWSQESCRSARGRRWAKESAPKPALSDPDSSVRYSNAVQQRTAASEQLD
jgi:hypothetical protein